MFPNQGMGFPQGGMFPQFFPSMNMNMNMNVQGGNQGWAQGYTSINGGMQNQKVNFNQGGKINCVFNTSTGKTFTILIDHGKTINDLIKIFFLRIEKPELMNNKLDICFLYNATKINIDSQEKVENFFRYNANPRISVNDIRDLIGA